MPLLAAVRPRKDEAVAVASQRSGGGVVGAVVASLATSALFMAVERLSRGRGCPLKGLPKLGGASKASTGSNNNSKQQQRGNNAPGSADNTAFDDVLAARPYTDTSVRFSAQK